MKRVKHVYPCPYHAWAHQALADTGENWGRNATRCKSFRGEVAYSYREPIGRIENYGGRTAYILSTRKYSVTTSQHQRDLAASVPIGSTVFAISFDAGFSYWSSYSGEDYDRKQFEDAASKYSRARTYWSKLGHARIAYRIAVNRNGYAIFRGEPVPDWCSESVVRHWEETVSTIEREREAMQSREEAAREARELEKVPKYLERIREWRHVAIPNQRFRYRGLPTRPW